MKPRRRQFQTQGGICAKESAVIEWNMPIQGCRVRRGERREVNPGNPRCLLKRLSKGIGRGMVTVSQGRRGGKGLRSTGRDGRFCWDATGLAQGMAHGRGSMHG